MKAMVTGGAGFIGSHICHRLLEEGHEVIALDNFDPYYPPVLKRRNIEPLLSGKRFELVEGDVRDRRLVRKTIEQGVDYVFHYAARAGVRTSVQDPFTTHDVNTTGLLSILEACLNSGVKKIINASSSSVYGKVKYLPIDEDHPTIPVSPYGVSKLAAEHYCRVYSEIHRLKIISLRLFTVYGPRMRPDLAISIFTEKSLGNLSIEILGSGDKTRDFTYIDDVVEANLLAIEKGEGGFFNIGSGARISIMDLAKTIVQSIGGISDIVCMAPQVGDAQHTWASIGKASAELGYDPQYDLNHGLQCYIDWRKAFYEHALGGDSSIQ